MLVPLDESPQALFLRAHETGHVAITPTVEPGKVAAENDCSVVALQVCEDARVHWFLERAGVDRSAGGMTDEDIVAGAARLASDPRALAAALVASDATGDKRRITDAVRALCERYESDPAAWPEKMPVPIDRETRSEIDRGVRLVVQAVRRENSRGRHHPAMGPRGFLRNTVPAAKLYDSLFGDGGAVERMTDGSKEGQKIRDLFGDASSEIVPWGELRSVNTLSMLAPRTAGRRFGHTSTFRNEGAMPNAVHRWSIDGRIFRRRRPAPGGTVLVDVSGSMSLSADDLREIVLAAPAATVAMYSGSDNRGDVTIVARRGKVASERDMARAQARSGGGNVIDGPALRWLAGQPGPRVWVSDGYVTGTRDRFARNLIAEAFAIVARAGIVRVGRASKVAGMIADLNRRPR